jgi:hypothetical protein
MPAMKQSKTPMRPLPRVTVRKQGSDYATWFAPERAAVAGEIVCEDGCWYASIRGADLPGTSGKTARAAAVAALDAWEAAHLPKPEFVAPVLCLAPDDAPPFDIDAHIAREQRVCDICHHRIEWEQDGEQCARCAANLAAENEGD